MSNFQNGADYLFRKKEEVKKNNARRHVRKRIVFLVVFFILAFLALIYYYSPLSRLSYINISGNSHIPESEILNLIQLKEGDLRLKANPLYLKEKLDTNPFIERFESKVDLDGRLNLVIYEKKPIGYLMQDNIQLLFSDGTLYQLNSRQYHWLMGIPLLKDFTTEDYPKLTEALLRIDDSVLCNVSEVVKYPMSYNTEMIYFEMEDGNHMFMDLDLSSNLNYYYSILKQLNAQKSCIFVDDASQNAYTSSCPWEAVSEEEAEEVEEEEDKE